MGVRRDILDAALECFVSDGYEATTIARIREHSGVSNGALFHHFRTKETIADALYVEAITSFQDGLRELIGGQPLGGPPSLHAVVRATIAHLLRWTEENPDSARFVYARGHLDWDSPASAELATRNSGLAFIYRRWLGTLVDASELRESSMLVMTAIVAGPAHAIVRRWLAGQVEGAPIDYLDELADAAYAGLRRQPSRTRPAGVKDASRARLTLELLDADGHVRARGVTNAQLSHTDGGDAELEALVPADV